MVSNVFGYTGSGNKRYNALFPPHTTTTAIPDSDNVVLGDNFGLTKSWRIVESVGEENAYLTVQYYNSDTKTWTQVHTFNVVT